MKKDRAGLLPSAGVDFFVPLGDKKLGMLVSQLREGSASIENENIIDKQDRKSKS